ncbi:uncharacterized protein LOC114363958 isoform X1 [Ostrinia furnacalis]|uniref:uncharacterized protein LOC114363958 isoform X1 n=1 Tax=Ostrinia furnacalis TaxID=93504 RepID=UPI00103B9D6B|nr:uncharacterized protein LOC114363958 isoform X1 [Ostrinia furnacalis]
MSVQTSLRTPTARGRYRTRYSREQANEEYGTQLNGDSQRAPPWPVPVNQNEIMFLLPRILQRNDRIKIAGTLTSDPRLFTINLVTGQDRPDYSNIAFQLETSIPNDQFTTKIIYNGQQNIIPDDPSSGIGAITPSEIIEGPRFDVEITIRISEDINPILDVSFNSVLMKQLFLKHNLSDIRFLTIDGDVQKIHQLHFELS